MSAPMEAIADGGATSPLWLLTFADLTAILVALFVLMYSMSAPFGEKGSSVLSGGVSQTVLSSPNNSADRFSGRSEQAADLSLGYLSAVLSDRGIAPTGQARVQSAPVTQSVEGGRLVLRIASDYAFSADGAALTPRAMDMMSDLAAVLSNVANPVSVFASVSANDWTLAFDRADGVVNAFRHFGYGASIERFVTPGISGEVLVIVIGRVGGARS